jgi:hypothetical protein
MNSQETQDRSSSQARVSLGRAIACFVILLITLFVALVLGVIGPDEGIQLLASSPADPLPHQDGASRSAGLSLRFRFSQALLQSNGEAMVGVTLGSITVAVFALTGIPAVVFGMRSLRLAKQVQLAATKPAIGGIVTAFAGMLGFSALLVAGVPNLFHMAQEARSARNLWALTLAMHSYHDAHYQFPPASFSHADLFEILRRIDPTTMERISNLARDSPQARTPLLSWRVLILPYLPDESCKSLFKQFHLYEPWDSPHNKALLPRMPGVFAGAATGEPFSTRYKVFVGQEAAFRNELKTSLRVSNFTDGTADTILIVEAAVAVPWTKPGDLAYDPQKPLPKLGVSSKGFCAAFADHGIWFIHSDFNQAALRAAITPYGRETLEWNELRATKLIPSPREWPEVYKYWQPVLENAEDFKPVGAKQS